MNVMDIGHMRVWRHKTRPLIEIENLSDGPYASLDKTEAKELINVLQEFVNNKEKKNEDMQREV